MPISATKEPSTLLRNELNRVHLILLLIGLDIMMFLQVPRISKLPLNGVPNTEASSICSWMTYIPIVKALCANNEQLWGSWQVKWFNYKGNEDETHVAVVNGRWLGDLSVIKNVPGHTLGKAQWMQAEKCVPIGTSPHSALVPSIWPVQMVEGSVPRHHPQPMRYPRPGYKNHPAPRRIHQR